MLPQTEIENNKQCRLFYNLSLQFYMLVQLAGLSTNQSGRLELNNS